MRDEDHSQQLPQRVRGEDHSQQLPQRVRGAARAGPDRPAQPHPPDRPGMSDDLRERIQAAVAAERANAAQGTEHAAASSERGNPAATADASGHNPMPQRVRGAARAGADRKVVQEQCVKYTIRDGVIFDSQALLRDVRDMVSKAKGAGATNGD